MKSMKKMLAVVLTLTMIFAMTACGQNSNDAESWPSKTLTITVPYSSGGDTDLYARIIADELENKLGQTVVVENVTGSGEVDGALAVKNSPADGYSVFFAHYGKLVSQACNASGGLDFIEDFSAGPTVIVDNSYVLCTSAKLNLNNYDELKEYAEAHPGELSIIAQENSNGYDIVAKIENATGMSFNKVEGESSVSDRMAALLGGQQDMIYGNYMALSDYIENGDIIPIASIGEERADSLPDLPCFTELSGNPVVSPYIFCFSFPKDTDSAIVDKFDNVIKELCKDPGFVEKINERGGNIRFATSAESDAEMREMVDQIKKRLGLE